MNQTQAIWSQGSEVAVRVEVLARVDPFKRDSPAGNLSLLRSGMATTCCGGDNVMGHQRY